MRTNRSLAVLFVVLGLVAGGCGFTRPTPVDLGAPPPVAPGGDDRPAVEPGRGSSSATPAPAPAVGLGSAGNELGSDPELAAQAWWLNISGPGGNPDNGDQYTAGRCPDQNRIARCSTANPDFDPNGYSYVVHVDPGHAGRPLVVSAYDPAYVATGDTCTETGAELRTLAEDLGKLGDRYDRAAFCTGDAVGDGGAPPDTTYIVSAPTGGGGPARPVCATTYRGSSADGLAGRVLAGLDRHGRPRAGHQLAASFHRWDDLCTVPAEEVVAGDYQVRVTTAADLSRPLPAAVTHADPGADFGSVLATAATPPPTVGYNRFSLRAGWGDDPRDPAWSSGIGVHATSRLAVASEQGVRPIRLPLGTLTGTPPGLKVRLYDLADATGGSGAGPTVSVTGGAGSGTLSCTTARPGGADPPAAAPCRRIDPPSSPGDEAFGAGYELTVRAPGSPTCRTGSTGCPVDLRITVDPSAGGTYTDTFTITTSAP